MLSRRKITESIARQLLEGADQEKLLQQLAAYVVSNNLENQLDLIVADIDRYLAEAGQVRAAVTSARPLIESIKEVIVSYVREASDAQHVTLEEHIDPTIIGGAIIETPTDRLDMSVATTLKQLRNS